MAIIPPPDVFKTSLKTNDTPEVQQRKKSEEGYYGSLSSKQLGSTLFSVQKLRHLRPKLKIRSNIATLTKKYARFLFEKAGLNKDKDEFSKELFYRLIREHLALFNVYMAGFHTYIWQETDGQVEFNNISPWMEGEATETHLGQRQRVYLKYVRTTIFVLPYQRSTLPRDIISLEGLSVSGVSRNG